MGMNEIFNTIIGYQGDHPKDVSKAYQDLRLQLENDSSRGSMGSAQVAPQSGQQEQDTSLERWKKQINGMIESGNPVLQKKGMSMLGNYQQRATAQQATPHGMSTYGKIAKDMGFTPGTKPFFDEVKRQEGFNDDKEDVVSVSESEHLFRENPDGSRGDRVAPFTPRSELGPVIWSKDADEETIISQAVLDIANENLFGQNGIYTEYGDSLLERGKFTIESNLQQLIQTDSRYRSYDKFMQGTAVMLAKSFGESGALSNQDVQRAMSLMPSITGLVVDSREVAMRKMQFLQELINAHKSGNGPMTERLTESMTANYAKQHADKNNNIAEGGQVIGQVYDDYIYLGGPIDAEESYERK